MPQVDFIPSELEYINCNFCKSNIYSEIYRSDSLIVVRCNKCNLVYTNPRPSKPWALKHNNWDDYYRSKEKDFINSYTEDYGKFKSGIDLIKMYKKDGSLLDLGCGRGLFLKIAKDQGFDVIGIEAAKQTAECIEKSYGIKVAKIPLKDIKFENNRFDIITLWDVLEHLYEPIETLKECYRICKSGGLIFLKVPNIYEFYLHNFLFWRMLRKLLRSKTYHDVIELQEWGHIYHFSVSTLKNFLVKAGFGNIRIHVMNKGLPTHIFKLPRPDLPRQIVKYVLFYLTNGNLDLFMPIVMTARK